MGLFNKIFTYAQKTMEAETFFKTLTAYSPVFTSWGGEIYESELVRACIHAKAKHISKLKVDFIGTGNPTTVTKLKIKPNPWQTWGQFLYRLSTILEVQTTAFIVPMLDRSGRVNGLFPVLPSMCEVVEAAGEPFLRFRFPTGDTAAVEMSRCGVMTKFQYRDDLFGSGNQALNPTMEMINVQEQGISEGVKRSGVIQFIAKLGNFAKDSDIEKEQKRFSEKNLKGAGGVLLFPNTYQDIKQINAQPINVSAEQMKIIKENVFDYTGANEDVLQNKFNADGWDAFYEGEIEVFALQFSEVVTAMLYTERQQELGSRIMATANRLQYMSVKDKIAFCREMGDRGYIWLDEGREVFNMPPYPNGEGQKAPTRGEYYFMGPGQKKEEGENENGN